MIPPVAPRVFISSTVLDLKPFRECARDAVLAADCLPKMQEFFPSGNHPPLAECLKNVAACHVLFVIVAHRYGWVPPDQPAQETSGTAPAVRSPGQKSITWLECERAIAEGLEVRAFLLDDESLSPPPAPCQWSDDWSATTRPTARGSGTSNFRHRRLRLGCTLRRLAAVSEV